MSSNAIQSGTGAGNWLRVDGGNRAHVWSTNEPASEAALFDGRSYNFNTEDVSITGATSLLYCKNDAEVDFVIELVVVGIEGGSFTSNTQGKVTLEFEPTGGTLLSTATACSINVNLNDGSTNTFNGDVYEGADGATSTGGTNAFWFYATQGGRSSYSISAVIPKSRSFAINVDPNLSSGSTNAYVAVVGHYRDNKLV